MIKKIITIVILVISMLLMFLLGSCADSNVSAKNQSIFDISQDLHEYAGCGFDVYILTDLEYNQEYIVITSLDNSYAQSTSITPRIK